MNQTENIQELEIIEFPREGYQPLVNDPNWRVAVLKFCGDLKIENIKTMQKHLETDEVFVLLQGSCTLFLGEAGELPKNLKKAELKPHKIYLVKKGMWHNHIMSEDGEVLIVENADTSDENSPIQNLTEMQICDIRNL